MNGINILRSSVLAMAVLFGMTSLFAAANQNTATTNQDTEFFVDEALMKGWVAIANAKLALSESDAQEVKAFAHHMIKDYEDINAQLMELAREKNVVLSTGNELHERIKPLMLEVQDGEFFDVAYANNQAIAHEQTLRSFQRALESTNDEDLTAFIRRTLPLLDQQLRMAEQLVSATAETKTDIYQDREGKTFNDHQHLEDLGEDTDTTDNL